MAKTRLNKTHRELLQKHAESTILPDKEIKAKDSAYNAMLKELKVLHNKEYPSDKMKVLIGYGQMVERTEVLLYVTYSDRNTDRLDISLEKDDGFKTLSAEDNCWGYRQLSTVTSKSKIVTLHKKWEEKKKLFYTASRKIAYDMKQLIQNAKTFEDVVEIWSGAEDLKDDICIKEISCLSDDVIDRIKTYNK